MSITNYTELKARISDWLNRDDITDAALADFVQIAENKIFHQLRVPTMEKTAYCTPDSEGKVTIPGDFLEAKDVFYSDSNFTKQPLSRVSLTVLYNHLQKQGVPEEFARETIYLRFWPTPFSTGTITLVYYAQPTALSSSNPTNAIFSMAPELYLYGALVAAGAYIMVDPAKMQLWSQLFEEMMQRMTDHARISEYSGAVISVANGY